MVQENKESMVIGDSPETIPIREGEDFDHARLAEYLKGKLPGTEQPLAGRTIRRWPREPHLPAAVWEDGVRVAAATAGPGCAVFP